LASGGIAIGGTIDERLIRTLHRFLSEAQVPATFKGKVDVNKLAFLSNFADAASAGAPDSWTHRNDCSLPTLATELSGWQFNWALV
jgi:hypothetical protein